MHGLVLIEIKTMRNSRKWGSIIIFNRQQYCAVEGRVRVDAKDDITVETIYSALIIRHLERKV